MQHGNIGTIGEIVVGQTYEEVSPDTSLREACRTLCQRGLAALAVVDEGRLVGILSEHDIILRAIGPWRPINDLTVADVMTRAPRSVERSTATTEALALMRAGRIRHLPVLERGQPIAILSVPDVPTIDRLMVERYSGCCEGGAAA